MVNFGALICKKSSFESDKNEIFQSSPCLDFWEASPIYQLYPRSFKDCDPDEYPDRKYDPENNPSGICGDGVGDIPGIIQKLDYLSNDLGIKVCQRHSSSMIFKYA